jgi:hypothetical protein
MVLDPNFQAFQWCWPGRYQPLHALMILIREIDQNPRGPSVRTYIAIVDQALALCSPSGGLTVTDRNGLVHRQLNDGGSEAWDLINRLRARVWTKCGADPDILPSRQEVYICAKERAAGLIEFDVNLREEADNQATSSEQYASAQVQSSQHHQSELFGGEDIIIGGGPTPNIDWTEWEGLFATQDGGDLNFIYSNEDS